MAERTRDHELDDAIETLTPDGYLDYEGITYRRTTGSRGEQLNLKDCPVCGGSEWKVYLNAESGLGNCFHGSCEAKFNKFTFIKAHSGLLGGALVAHIKQLAKELGWAPRKVATAVPVQPIKGELKLPASFPIPHEGKNLLYLEKRGVTPDIAQYFHLRYCLDGFFEYPSPGGRVIRQNYSRRVIIPIFDLDGKFVSFQGRDITGEAEKKYLFPPGYASTGAHLYNGQNVAVGTTRVLVGEGAFDVIAQKIALDGDMSLRDIVPIGTFGKHLSEGNDDSQLAKFLLLRERGVKEVTFMWDAEKQALEDAVKAGLLLRSMGFVVRIALLPPGKDPNEVPAAVVRKAYYEATALTKLSAVKLLMTPIG